jgi:hypothetical protein
VFSCSPVLEEMAFYPNSIPTPAHFLLIKFFPFEIEIRRPDFSTARSLLHLAQKTACFYLSRLQILRAPKSKFRQLNRQLQQVIVLGLVLRLLPASQWYTEIWYPVCKWPGSTVFCQKNCFSCQSNIDPV